MPSVFYCGINSNMTDNNLTPNDRNMSGQFLPGNKVSVGKNPFQYAKRAEYLQGELTAGDIMRLCANPDELHKYSVIDVQIIKRLGRTMKTIEPTSCSEVDRALEYHLDRTDGPVNQNINHTGTITHTPLTAEQRQEAHEMLMRYQLKHTPNKEIIDVTPT